MFGAVNNFGGSYWGTGAGHCILKVAVMCYNDNSPGGANYPINVCPDATPNGVTLDCGYDTLFRTKHVPGSWLQTHWNTGGAENKIFTISPAWDYSISCAYWYLC